MLRNIASMIYRTFFSKGVVNGPGPGDGSNVPNRRHRFRRTAILGVMLILVLFAPLLFSEPPQPLSKTEPLNLETLATHPHDKTAFTQGLFYEDGFLYESTGQYGSSTLRKVEIATGKTVMQVRLPKQYFAEGLERVGDRIFQLTWREGYCLVYDKKTFRFLGHFRYSGEGWGLAWDGRNLVLSDGSAKLRFFDPETFKEQRSITVTDRHPKTGRNIPVRNLNELEYVRGEIWANVWQSTYIVRIDPETGNVIGWIDCTGFVPEELKAEILGRSFDVDRVLNGIAFDPQTNRVFITGKNWPSLYEIRIVDPVSTPGP